MRIRFVQSLKVQQNDGNGPEYLADRVYDFDGFVAETYARKYVRLGYAVEVVRVHLEPAVVAETLPAAVAPEALTPSPELPAATEQIPNAGLPAPGPEPIPNAPVVNNVSTWPKQRRNRRS